MSWITFSLAFLVVLMAPSFGVAFTSPSPTQCSATQLYMGGKQGYNAQGRSSPRYGKERSKRQERVGHLVRTELSQIIHTGLIKGDPDFLDDELRKRISIINADVSPDLRQARITVSIRKGAANEGDEGSNLVIDRRRAYSWLVQNTKPLRHTLAQQMSHIKTTPDLSFVQADISAAVDVMYLIDKITAGAKRSSIGAFGGDDDSLPRGMVEGMDFDEFDEDDGWIDDDDDEDDDEDDDDDDDDE
jgi:ribosome-binding factor A